MTEFEKLLFEEIKGMRQDLKQSLIKVHGRIDDVEKKEVSPIKDKLKSMQFKFYVLVIIVLSMNHDKSDKLLSKLSKFLLPF